MNGQMMEDSVDMKQKVEDILTKTGYSEQRAAKMSVDDLLKYVLSITIDMSFNLLSDYYQHSTTSVFTLHDSECKSNTRKC